jgi:hypothetical protein
MSEAALILLGAVSALLGAGSVPTWRAVIQRRETRWVGDLRPGTVIAGPGRNESWTVVSTSLSAERGQPPTLRLDLIAGAPPRSTP